ncbi:hypothetical protein ASG43_08465 [Aureimonas sp. Leaf454]|nr:hypothetical protein ASG43_08465 [Aureimonas sp. Leaf454]
MIESDGRGAVARSSGGLSKTGSIARCRAGSSSRKSSPTMVAGEMRAMTGAEFIAATTGGGA